MMINVIQYALILRSLQHVLKLTHTNIGFPHQWFVCIVSLRQSSSCTQGLVCPGKKKSQRGSQQYHQRHESSTQSMSSCIIRLIRVRVKSHAQLYKRESNLWPYSLPRHVELTRGPNWPMTFKRATLLPRPSSLCWLLTVQTMTVVTALKKPAVMGKIHRY